MTVHFRFDNSYARLPDRFFARLPPTPVTAPKLIKLNGQLASELGLDPEWLARPEGVQVLAGNRVPEGAEPTAMAYAGHQFGNFVPQLGDGRAILLGEVVGRDVLRRDIQLKGSGPTPFSRRGDGRAALGPVLREHAVSEAMAIAGETSTQRASTAGRSVGAGASPTIGKIMATLEDYDASGALLIWHDVVIGRAADVARWYNCEHHLERLSIPGFERVTRGHAISARAREFFVLYETENPGVLRSEDYLSRLNAPTMWTRKTMTSFRNNSRTVCKVTSQLGYADGGALATLSLRDRTSARWALETMSQTLERAYSSGEILRAIVTEPIGETDDVAATTELGLRGRPDSHTAGTAIIVASTPAEASAALEKLTRSLHPTVHDDLFESGVYATTFALRARDLALGSSQTV